MTGQKRRLIEWGRTMGASIAGDVGEAFGDPIDLGSRLQQDAHGVPGPGQKLIASAVRDRGRETPVSKAYQPLLQIQHDLLFRMLRHGPQQPYYVLRVQRQAWEPDRRTVTEEDLSERPAHDAPDAPAPERLRRMFPRGAAAEVLADNQNRRPSVASLVERVIRHLPTVVLKDVRLKPFKGDAFQEAGGDDPVGIDVVTGERNCATGDLTSDIVLSHDSISRTSVIRPRMAAAATMAGLMRRVRPVGLPMRPLKFLLLEAAHSSRPVSLSSFIPRQSEQPALRHSNPALRKTSCNPSASAALATVWDPGTTRAR